MRRATERYEFGHAVYCSKPNSPEHPSGEWRYCDDDGLVHDLRLCPRCLCLRVVNGQDPCIANLPNVRSACCGHGVTFPYVVLNDGTQLLDQAALDYFKEHTLTYSALEELRIPTDA